MTFTEYSYWSPILGDDAVRLSVFNDRGGELYVIIPDGPGYVDRRREALELLTEAINQGLPPGEVRVRCQSEPATTTAIQRARQPFPS